VDSFVNTARGEVKGLLEKPSNQRVPVEPSLETKSIGTPSKYPRAFSHTTAPICRPSALRGGTLSFSCHLQREGRACRQPEQAEGLQEPAGPANNAILHVVILSACAPALLSVLSSALRFQ